MLWKSLDMEIGPSLLKALFMDLLKQYLILRIPASEMMYQSVWKRERLSSMANSSQWNFCRRIPPDAARKFLAFVGNSPPPGSSHPCSSSALCYCFPYRCPGRRGQARRPSWFLLLKWFCYHLCCCSCVHKCRIFNMWHVHTGHPLDRPYLVLAQVQDN